LRQLFKSPQAFRYQTALKARVISVLASILDQDPNKTSGDFLSIAHSNSFTIISSSSRNRTEAITGFLSSFLLSFPPVKYQNIILKETAA